MVRLAEALLVGRAVVLILAVEPIGRLCGGEEEEESVRGVCWFAAAAAAAAIRTLCGTRVVLMRRGRGVVSMAAVLGVAVAVVVIDAVEVRMR